MKLDCNETEDGQWQIIDYDNSCKQICVGNDPNEAWYRAAKILESMINSAKCYLST